MKIEDVNDISKANSMTEALNKHNEIEKSNTYEVDISKLPSKGKIYPDGTKIYGRRLRPSMLNKLASMTPDNMDIVCNEVLANSISGIDYREIGVGDKWYLVYWLRDISFKGKPFKIGKYCNSCKKNIIHDYYFNDLGIIYLPETFEKVINLEVSKDNVLIDLPRIKNEFVTNSLKKDEIASKYDESVINFSINISSVNGKSLTPLEKCEYIENLDPIDYSILMNALSETTIYGITFTTTFNCDCGEKLETIIPLNAQFFLPKFR